MSKKQAMWIHGTAVRPEREGYHINRSNIGWGARVRSTGKEWFHFPVPTPVIFDGKNSKVIKVFVLYSTKMNAKITHVHLYDGKTKFKTFKNLTLSGSHDGKLDASNTWIVSPRHLKWGLNISVHVDFGSSTPQGVPEITFASAGADFVVN